MRGICPESCEFALIQAYGLLSESLRLITLERTDFRNIDEGVIFVKVVEVERVGIFYRAYKLMALSWNSEKI